jgi:hypothetical protein
MDDSKEHSAGDPLSRLMKEDEAYRQNEELERDGSAPHGSVVNNSIDTTATTFGMFPSAGHNRPREDVDGLEAEHQKIWQDVLEDRWNSEGDESQPKLDDLGNDQTVDVADIGIPTSPGNSNLDFSNSSNNRQDEGRTTTLLLPPRPPLRKSQFDPPSQNLPHPPATQQAINETTTDSFSLPQLKRPVGDMPGREPTAYTFVYEDTAAFPDELEEWFSYRALEKEMLSQAKDTFDESWAKICNTESRSASNMSEPPSWLTAPPHTRTQLVEAAIQKLEATDIALRIQGLEVLIYIILGTWGETAGLEAEDILDLKGYGNPDGTYRSSTLQLQSILEGAALIYDAIGIPSIFTVFRGACSKTLYVSNRTFKITWLIHIRAKLNSDFDFEAMDLGDDQSAALESRELYHSMTLMYVLIEAGRQQVAEENSLRLRDDIGLCFSLSLDYANLDYSCSGS